MGGDMYNKLPSDKDAPASSASSSLCLRLAIVCSALFACLFNSGLAFGFSALLPVLLDIGAFHDYCPAGVKAACNAQNAALTGMFTVASSLLNVAAMPTGALLDVVGPRLTAGVAALLVAVGTFIFSLGGDGPMGHAFYYGGFLVFAVAGPAVFNCTLSFGNLFPGREGLIAAALVGCFDASSAIFVGIAGVIDGGVTFTEAFQGYSVIPFVAAVVALLIWPKKPVDSAAGDEAEGSGAPFEGLSVKEQISTGEYMALSHTVGFQMVCINFFIATCLRQMQAVNPDTATQLTTVFATMLPIGGFAHVPFTGLVVDNYGPTVGYLLLWVLYVLFQACLYMYSVTSVTYFAYGAFLCMAWVRPLFYTLGAVFVGQFFGYKTFGRVYGLATTIAGICNFAVQPLDALATSHGFQVANGVILGAQLTTILLPLLVFCRQGRKAAGFVRTKTGSSVLDAARARGASVSQ